MSGHLWVPVNVVTLLPSLSSLFLAFFSLIHGTDILRNPEVDHESWTAPGIGAQLASSSFGITECLSWKALHNGKGHLPWPQNLAYRGEVIYPSKLWAVRDRAQGSFPCLLLFSTPKMVPSDIYIIIFKTLPLKAKEEERKKKSKQKNQEVTISSLWR